jgi:hypothetical protein
MQGIAKHKTHRRLTVIALSSREYAVLTDLQRVRLLSGGQLERLHFAELATANARGSARRRTLGGLVYAGLVTTCPGASAVSVLALLV